MPHCRCCGNCCSPGNVSAQTLVCPGLLEPAPHRKRCHTQLNNDSANPLVPHSDPNPTPTHTHTRVSLLSVASLECLVVELQVVQGWEGVTGWEGQE